MNNQEAANADAEPETLQNSEDELEAEDGDNWQKEYLKYMAGSSTYDPKTGRSPGIVFRLPAPAHRD